MLEIKYEYINKMDLSYDGYLQLLNEGWEFMHDSFNGIDVIDVISKYRRRIDEPINLLGKQYN